jgi:hypothetical protein
MCLSLSSRYYVFLRTILFQYLVGNYFTEQNIIRAMNSKSIRWVRHVEMWKSENCLQNCILETLKERLAHDSVQRLLAFVNTVTKL